MPTREYVSDGVGIKVMASVLSTDFSGGMETTIAGAFLEYAFEHWVVLLLLALIMVGAVIYVLMKN